jgi:uncharacterized damage-inducible protein DinB
MDARIRPLASQLGLNASLIRRALELLRTDDWLRRPVAEGSNAAFVAAHLLEARASLVRILGGDPLHAWSATLEQARSVEDLGARPSPAEVAEAFDLITARLEERLSAATEEDLEAPSGHDFPTGDGTVLGAAAFLSLHESYHVGQLALLVRALGRGSLTGR